MEYKVITVVKDYFSNEPITDATNELAYKVNKEIERGWKPQGGICVIRIDDNTRTCVSQALIKE